METGHDALTFLHFGAAIGSRRVSCGGYRQFVRTIRLLGHHIDDNHDHSLDYSLGIFCAALQLLSCEVYKVVSSGLRGWDKHIAGIDAILRTTLIPATATDFNVRLIRQFRHVALMYALVERTRITSMRHYTSWLDRSAKAYAAERLTVLALELPALLEATDGLQSSCGLVPSLSARDVIYSRLQDVASKLKSLLRDWRWEDIKRIQNGGTLERHGHTRPQLHETVLSYAFHQVVSLLVHEARYSLISTDGQPAVVVKTAGDTCASQLLASLSLLKSTTDGDVDKAQAIRAPLFFVLLWYNRTRSLQAMRECLELDRAFRAEFYYLDWDALLPFSFSALQWLQ